MARLRTSRRANRAAKGNQDDGHADFAVNVIAQYRRALGTPSIEAPANADRNVRSVAVGLATIRRALDRELAEIKAVRKLGDFPASGLHAAFGILEALTSGRASPLWSHVNGLRSARFRAQKAPPGNIEMLGRWCVVGLVRGYQGAAEVSESKAIQTVIDACRFEDFEFQVGQIKGWNRRFRATNDAGPDAAARTLLEKARKLDRPWPMPERVLAVGRTWVWQLFTVPTLGESPRSTPR